MSNILNFPTPKGKHEIPEEWTEPSPITQESYDSVVEIGEKGLQLARYYANELNKIKSMTFWQRICFVIFGY